VTLAVSSPESLLLRVVQLREEANAVCKSLVGGDYEVIGYLSLRTPPTEPAELAFIRVVAWLYVQYFEAGDVGVKFLSEKFDTYGIDAGKAHRDHVRRSSSLRTYLQHNLSPTSRGSSRTQEICEDWFEASCGSRIPGGSDDHWRRCLCVHLEDADALFRCLLRAARMIEEDEAREMIVDQWRDRVQRHHPGPAFDPIIGMVASDMGRSHLNVVKFRRRYHDRWAGALRELEGSYDFDHEARKLIEYAMLTDGAATLPITGADLIGELGISPGPRVGELLVQAKRLFDNEPCDRDKLLARLGRELDRE
jgi:hypothetical protein